jgi:hypothetical protein
MCGGSLPVVPVSCDCLTRCERTKIRDYLKVAIIVKYAPKL